MIYEIDLLNDEQLEYINTYFKYLKFEDGRKSNYGVKKVCQTVFDGPGSLDLNDYCHDIIVDADLPFSISKISQIYFVKYGIGGQYKDHYDANICGGVKSDYSMTCFLNDNYAGGELVITTKDGERNIKLNRGKAILYPGNLLHRINEVTSGRRDVFICWIEK
jgi:PKHD-type hydroxylase